MITAVLIYIVVAYLAMIPVLRWGPDRNEYPLDVRATFWLISPIVFLPLVGGRLFCGFKCAAGYILGRD